METTSHSASVHGHSMHDSNAHGTHDRHEAQDSRAGHAGHDHGLMVAELKRRFWISLLLTLPILILSPVIQHALGLRAAWRFSGDTYVLAVLASAIYFYGGWPFLQGLKDEISSRNLGMMTLIGVAITAAYIYSLATLLGLPGNDFFWELWVTGSR
jgi:Cu2+-exporting ATPase